MLLADDNRILRPLDIETWRSNTTKPDENHARDGMNNGGKLHPGLLSGLGEFELLVMVRIPAGLVTSLACPSMSVIHIQGTFANYY